MSFGGIDYQALEQIRIGGLPAAPTAVPEPASLLLLGSGLMEVVRRCKRTAR